MAKTSRKLSGPRVQLSVDDDPKTNPGFLLQGQNPTMLEPDEELARTVYAASSSDLGSAGKTALANQGRFNAEIQYSVDLAGTWLLLMDGDLPVPLGPPLDSAAAARIVGILERGRQA